MPPSHQNSDNYLLPSFDEDLIDTKSSGTKLAQCIVCSYLGHIPLQHAMCSHIDIINYIVAFVNCTMKLVCSKEKVFFVKLFFS